MWKMCKCVRPEINVLKGIGMRKETFYTKFHVGSLGRGVVISILWNTFFRLPNNFPHFFVVLFRKIFSIFAQRETHWEHQNCSQQPLIFDVASILMHSFKVSITEITFFNQHSIRWWKSMEIYKIGFKFNQNNALVGFVNRLPGLKLMPKQFWRFTSTSSRIMDDCLWRTMITIHGR